ncbi:MAG: MFS transporter [Gemmatales bacterium]|nr:MFS transporter [Gemmatales bacterium]MDW7994202.1 MFS transporter [Gemmatales bacterium]
MPTSARWKLSVMMFLEFFIWGAWFPLIFGYLESLSFNADWQQPLILGAFNIAAVTALFFFTQFADRHFAAERFVAFSHLIGGIAILSVPFIATLEVTVETRFWLFFAAMLLHSLFYVPTISITNSIAFTHLTDPQRDFGLVRLWGTIGWIAASWPFVFILADWTRIPSFPGLADRGLITWGTDVIQWLGTVLGTSKQGAELRQATGYTFITAGIASLILAAFSLRLPHTPPKRDAQASERLAWLQALKHLRVPAFLLLFALTFFDAAVHQTYFFWAGRYLEQAVGIPGNWVMPVMSVGQIAEILTMAILGWTLKRLGWRWTMTLGILGHALRFTAFALWPYPAVAIAANLLHGICYAFFFATVYIFVDHYFPKDARSSAQGLFNLLILGVGPFIGNFAAARLGEAYKLSEKLGTLEYDFRHMLLWPAGIAYLAALTLAIFFRPPQSKEPPLESTTA